MLEMQTEIILLSGMGTALGIIGNWCRCNRYTLYVVDDADNIYAGGQVYLCWVITSRSWKMEWIKMGKFR